MLFAAIDFYTLFAQHQRATHILNYYLERVRIEGYLSIQDEGEPYRQEQVFTVLLKEPAWS
jgi:hypothetical protein